MNQQTVGQLSALLGTEPDVALQFEWAALLAGSAGQDIIFLEAKQGDKDYIEEVVLADPEKNHRDINVLKLRQCIKTSPGMQAGKRPGIDADESMPAITYVRMKFVYYSTYRSLRNLLLKDTADEKIQTFTVLRPQIEMNNEELVRERRFFLSYMPCHMVFCMGLSTTHSITRVLAESSSGVNGKAALQMARQIAVAKQGTMTALQINPDIGALAAEVGAKRLRRNLDRVLGPDLTGIDSRVEIDDRTHAGLRRVWEEGNHDLIVIGRHRKQFDSSLTAKLGKAPVAIVSAGSPLRNTVKKMAEETIQRVVPQMTRTDRVDLMDRLQSSASLDFDFIALMVLSTTIAAIGLLQNSAAVVIGAMLVAPLMTPLLGLGLSLVQGNPVLARMSIRSVFFGVFVSLLGGFLVGILTAGYIEPTREMLARGRPGMLDLFVAYASGLAAAYASTRVNLVAALPGVAIAAALVPPIATSGLALSLGNFHLAFGALLIFFINMLTIVLASMTSLWAVGIRSIKKASRWMLISGNTMLGLVVLLSLYLSFQPADGELTKGFPPGLENAIQESLGDDYRLTALTVAYDELGVQLLVGVGGDHPASAKLAKKVRAVVRAHYNQPVRVRLLTKIEIEALGKDAPAIDENPEQPVPTSGSR